MMEIAASYNNTHQRGRRPGRAREDADMERIVTGCSKPLRLPVSIVELLLDYFWPVEVPGDLTEWWSEGKNDDDGPRKLFSNLC